MGLFLRFRIYRDAPQMAAAPLFGRRIIMIAHLDWRVFWKCRLRPRALRGCEDLLRLLQMRHVEHLAIEAHGPRARRKRVYHALRICDVLGRRRECIVDDRHLVGMNRDLAGKASAQCGA